MIQPNSSFPVSIRLRLDTPQLAAASFIGENLEKAKSFYSSYFEFGVVSKNQWYL